MIIDGKSEGLTNYIGFGLTAVFVAFVLVWAYKDTNITLEEEGLRIHGLYGGYYSWGEIKNLELKETLPTIQLRINGASLGGKLKGHFRTREFGNIKVFLDRKLSPFIYFDNNGKKIIFNLATPEATKFMYENLLMKTEK